MENTQTLQLVKEQLKIKTKELKKQTKEKNQLNEKIQSILTLNRKKIQELTKSIEKKDEEIKEAQSQAWAARIAKHTGKTSEGGTESDAGEPEEFFQDPNLLKEIDRLKAKENVLKEKIDEEKKLNQKNTKDKTLLLKELKRLRKELESIDELNNQIAKLKNDLNKRPEKSAREMEGLIREKDDLIENYEKMLYGNVDPGEEGMLPSEIIMDLKMELNDLMEERKKMVLDLDKLQEYVAQLEMKVALTDEKDASDRLETRMNADSRAAATAEFSSGLEGFLITYSDMITLLLAIFILMVSVSKIDAQKLLDATSSFQERKRRIDKKNYYLSNEEWEMMQWIKKESEKNNADYHTFVPGGNLKIHIKLQSDDYFDPGSAELIVGAEDNITKAIGDKHSEGLIEVEVEGHTDNVGMKSGSKFATNWELSAARAARVARVLIEKLKIPPEKIAATGYGEFRPIKKNELGDENRAANRRVEIVLIKDKEVVEEKERERQKNALALKEGQNNPQTAPPVSTQ